VLRPGDRAPSFELADVDDGHPVADPWRSGPVVLAFFKTTCPVCQQAAPKVQALADAGARVVAIGEDPPDALARYARRHGQRVPTVSEPAPYEVSDAFGLATVPSLLLVGADGVVVDAVESWDRDAWNRLAAAAGAGEVSKPTDGLPAFRPG
jgi:peroxiredoxin